MHCPLIMRSKEDSYLEFANPHKEAQEQLKVSEPRWRVRSVPAWNCVYALRLSAVSFGIGRTLLRCSCACARIPIAEPQQRRGEIRVLQATLDGLVHVFLVQRPACPIANVSLADSQKSRPLKMPR